MHKRLDMCLSQITVMSMVLGYLDCRLHLNITSILSAEKKISLWGHKVNSSLNVSYSAYMFTSLVATMFSCHNCVEYGCPRLLTYNLISFDSHGSLQCMKFPAWQE